MLTRLLLCAALALPLASLAAPSLREQQLEDLQVTRTDYVLRSHAFSMQGRLKALALLDAAKARAGQYSPAEFALLLARVSALSGNAHDLFIPAGWMPPQRLPVRTTWFNDGLMITRAAPEHSDLLGARIVAVEGKPPAALLALMHQHAGGPTEYVRSTATWLLEYPALLHAAGFARSADSVRLRLVLRDGRQQAHVLKAIDKSLVPQGMRSALLAKAPLAGEDKSGWKAAVQGADPLYLQEPEQVFRMRELPELDALYIQFRANYDQDGGKTLSAFAAQALKAAQDKPPRHVIIDQRFNIGGNSDLTAELMRGLAKLARGKVYVLTSQHTYSAGIVSSALAKQAGGAKTILVGARVGDTLRWWSEGVDVCLPHSGQCFWATRGLWDLEKGCKGEAGCYGDKFEANVGNLDPHIKAPMLGRDWLAGRDRGMEAVAADIRRQR